MISVALPAATGMELGSISRMRSAAAELAESSAAWATLQPAASSASRTVIRFIKIQGLVSADSVSAPRAGLAERNEHLDLRAGAANGFDLKGAAHVGRPLAHAEQTKAALSFSSGRVLLRVEADPIVLDRQLNEGALPQAHGNVAGAGVLLHILQSVLENAVERQLAFGGQPGGQWLAGQLERHARPMCGLPAKCGQRGGPAQLVPG